MNAWLLLFLLLSFIMGYAISKAVTFLSATSLAVTLVKSANLCCLYMFIKSFERVNYYNTLAINDYIKSGASERNIEVYKNNLQKEMELFKNRCIKTLVDSRPDAFNGVVKFETWPEAMLFVNENRDFIIRLFKGKGI